MSFTFDDAFKRSLSELEIYSKLVQEAKVANKALPHLTLTKLGNQPVLKVVKDDELGIGDIIAKRFGWGEFKLSKLVAYLQSEAFLKKLESTAISSAKQRAILDSARSLDPLIKDHNAHAFFKSSKIEMKRRNLFTTFRDHVRLLSDRTQATAGVILKPELAKKKLSHDVPTLDESFARNEKKLLADVSEGLVVVGMDGKLIFSSQNHWFYTFDKNVLLTLSPEVRSAWLNQVTNKVIMQQELRKLHSWTDSSDLFLKAYLERLSALSGKDVPSKNEIVQLLAKRLETFFSGAECVRMNPVELLMEIERQKIYGCAEAHNVPVNSRLLIIQTMQALYERSNALYHLVEKQHKQLMQDPAIRDLPPLAKEAFVGQIWGQFLEIRHEMLNKFVEKCGPKLLEGNLPFKDQRKVLREFSEEKIKTRLDQFVKDKVMPPIEFYRKWQKYLSWEMMQGFRDPNEALGEGVCNALSRRWAKEQFNGEPSSTIAEAIRRLNVNEISASDRVLQAKSTLAAAYYTGISEYAHFEDINAVENLKGAKQMKNTLRAWFQDPEFQNRFRGCAMLAFQGQNMDSGHAITITFHENPKDPSKSRFCVQDANIGKVQFPVDGNDLQAMKKAESLCLDFLVDLLVTHYSDNLKFLYALGPVETSRNERLESSFEQTHKVLHLLNEKERLELVTFQLLRSKIALAEEVAQGTIKVDSEGKLQIPPKHWFHTFLKHLPEFASYIPTQNKPELIKRYQTLELSAICKDYFEALALNLEQLAKEKSPLLVLKRIQALEEAYDSAQKFIALDTQGAWREPFEAFIFEQVKKLPEAEVKRLKEKISKSS